MDNPQARTTIAVVPNLMLIGKYPVIRIGYA